MTDSTFKVEFYERYSNLKTLHDLLRKETTSSTFPKFPPKKFFGSTDEKFLKQRQVELNTYFSSIFNNKEFSQLPSLKKWINDALNKNSTSSNIKSQPQPEQKAPNNVQNNKHEEKKSESEPSSANKENTENEIARIKEIIEQCSKKFIEMDRQQENDIQEDTDKVKEYTEICQKFNLFSEAEINNSQRLFNNINREDNFNEDDMNNAPFPDDNYNNANEILNSFNNKFFSDIEKVYDTSDLIISI